MLSSYLKLSMKTAYILSFIIGLILAHYFTPKVIKLAYKIGAIDVPKDNRRVHTRPIPRIGGIAIFASFVITTILFNNTRSLKLFGIFIALLIIVAMGVIDDTYGLSAKLKMCIQIIAAMIVVFTGTKINLVVNPLGTSKYIYLGMFSIPITIFWIVGVTNTVNLIDGLDGLAAGISAISSITFALILYKNGDLQATLLLVGLTGAIMGFLPYNFNPARIFMGDTGSLFLGFTLSVISIYATIKSAATLAVFVPILALGIPIFDTTFAIIRRAKNNKPIMQADKGHLHHRLLQKGLNQKETVLLLYLISVILGLSAYFIAEGSFYVSLKVFLIDLIFIIYIVKSTKLLNKEEPETKEEINNDTK